MSVIKPVYIEKKTEKDPALDFSFLREQGIELLQGMAGKTWTDFNFHDPGVTILEQLCFAITDMAYRTDAPIEDILTDIHGKISRADNSFFNREQILTTNPVTVNDFRKVILDDLADEVENVQMEPLISAYSSEYVKGLYKIMVQVNEDTASRIARDPAYEQEIVKKVMSSFLSKRNLSEDYIRDIVVLKAQSISIRSHIIIAEHVVPEEVLAGIYNKIDFALNPHISRYSEQELLERGLTVEQIYCGPLLKNGIILDSDLKPFKKEIDPSELVRAISEVEGVLYVQNLVINGDESTGMGKPFILEENHFPLLEIKPSRQEIRLYTDKYELQIRESVFRNILGKLHELGRKRATARKDLGGTDIEKGTYRDPERYESIQHYFPAVYGIGKEGLSVHEPEKRKAQARQLKAYLLFFEQVLANYLSQLSHVGKLFSPTLGRDNPGSYYFQNLYNVPGIEDLLSVFNDAGPGKSQSKEQVMRDENNAYIRTLKKQQETGAEYTDRKNRIFDHLLARINKTLNEYPVIMYNTLYGNTGVGKSTDLVLKWKAEILKNMVETNQDRIRAINYAAGNRQVAGFEKKMLALLHITPRRHQTLTEVFGEQHASLSQGTAPLAVEKDHAAKEEVTQEEELNVFLSRDEAAAMEKAGDIQHGSQDAGASYVFRNQGLSVLKYGINIENYRIAPGIYGGTRHSILYKSPAQAQWKMISSHSDAKVAMKALHRLIRSLKDISIGSEGFYIMEHVLLRPEISRPSFGFRFYETPQKLLFENHDWLGFEDREAHMAGIINAASAQPLSTPGGGDTPYKVYTHGNHSLLVKPREIADGKKHAAENEFRNVRDNLALLKDGQVNFYPRFELTAQLEDGTVIREDFFNFRMTVVLPSWPARFQDPDFRTFTEDLFRLNAPAYIRLDFMWIGLADMQKFEGLYFSWLDMFSREAPYSERNSQCARLIAFLKSGLFKIK